MLQPRIAVSSTATFGRDCWPDETRLLAGPIFVGPNTCWADHASWPTKRKWALLPHWADMGVNPLAGTSTVPGPPQKKVQFLVQAGQYLLQDDTTVAVTKKNDTTVADRIIPLPESF